ncbi:MAG: hypothetical protein LCH39_01810 [Proteobacteria bacterium]|nr:hypothetical protein [Pseudomonadota bacterium]
MATVTISFADQILARYGQQIAAAGNGGARKALSRALRHTGRKAKTQVARALVGQTGLKYGTLHKAVREINIGANALSYELMARGGNVRLKYFKARETRPGVSAAPWNKRKVFTGTFMKAGWWHSGRVDKPNWNGQVFRRAGGTTKNGKAKFEVVRSGLYIPDEMLSGASLASWHSLLQTDLLPRVGHELLRILPR